MSSQAVQPARRGRGHGWTKFELDIALGLICKGEHLESTLLVFATKLNEALNGSHSRTAYDNDVSVDEVRDLLAYIETEKKGALAFIERQPHPYVMTRTKKRVLERNIPFTGSKEEWIAGRKDKVMRMRKTDAPAAELPNSFTTAQDIQIERRVPKSEQEPSIQPGNTNIWKSGGPLAPRPNETPMPYGWSTTGDSSMTPDHYQFNPTALMPPAPITTVMGGWATPSSNTATFDKVVATNPNISWRVNPIQKEFNTMTSNAGQQPLMQQMSMQRNDPGQTSEWTKQATTSGIPCLKGNQPAKHVPEEMTRGSSEALAAGEKPSPQEHQIYGDSN